MKFKLTEYHRNITDEELLQDLQRVLDLVKEKNINLTSRSYDEFGKFTSGTVSRRFGSWNKAMIKLGVKPTIIKNSSHIELMENLKSVWLSLSRQPVARDIKPPLSQFGYSVYRTRYGTWRNALEKFIDYASEGDNELEDQTKVADSPKEILKRRTSRDISERLRFRILLRDGFTCQSCGASPLISRNVELHVDHIIPWSKGGESIEKNLETKCSRCNYGKGNILEKNIS